MRNFLVAVSEMNLLTFEASDIEKVRDWHSTTALALLQVFPCSSCTVVPMLLGVP
jgi:hypothetical protein